MDYKNAVCNSSGMFRIYGMFGKYGVTEKPRIWIGTVVDDDGELDPQTILYDSQGNPILGSEAKLPR